MLHASSPQCRRAGTTRSPAFSSGGARDEFAGVVLRLAADAALLVAELAAEEVRRVEPLRQLVAAVLLRERVAVHAAVLRAEGDERVAFRPVGGVGREDGGDLSRTGDMRSDAASQGKGTVGTRTVCIAADALVPYCASQLPSPKGSGCAPRAAWLRPPQKGGAGVVGASVTGDWVGGSEVGVTAKPAASESARASTVHRI